MADRLDVAERLAEGGPAVGHTQLYVQACQALGYRHPDLTARPFQVRDWYASEDGLDLRALDRDCGRLRAAASVLGETLRTQRAQAAELAAAWTGPGGEAAVRFVERHCDAAGLMADEIRAAAQRCESLRDNLWYLVDAKVATAVAVDERASHHQQEWLTAAAAVTTGGGDRAAAEPVVREQIGPYVEEDVRVDWLSAMRSTVAGVGTSYDMVIDRMAAAPAPSFELPGELRLAGQSLAPSAVPAARPAPADVIPASADVAPAPADVDPASPALQSGTAPENGLGMPASDLGGGMGGTGDTGGIGGLAGLAGRIIDAVGGLLGSAGGGDLMGEDGFDAGDPFRPDEPDVPKDADAKDADAKDAEDKDADEKREAEAEDEREVDPVVPAPSDTAPASAPESVAPAVAPTPAAPTPAAAPPPAALPAPGGPAPAGEVASTPCQIAADQLPQAGR